MAQGTSHTIGQAEYEAIEAAVMETARGRWFLAEFARRNRTADTQVLLEAIGRLEQAVAAERSAQDLDRLRFDLMEMAKAIALTKSEIAAIRPADHQQSHLIVATEALDAISRTTERATSEILESAEHIQEAAWTLREDGADPAICDELDRRATEIYTACSFQDLTAQRIAKIVQTLRYLEGRINAMIDIWGAAAPAVPESPPAARSAPDPILVEDDPADLTQNDVDIVIVDNDLFGHDANMDETRLPFGQAPGLDPLPDPDELTFIEAAPEAWAFNIHQPIEAVAPERPPVRLEAFAAIDTLDTREKLKRFT
jgi:chemotaxis regulatin CheY-phosphate phosphatase CheZ